MEWEKSPQNAAVHSTLWEPLEGLKKACYCNIGRQAFKWLITTILTLFPCESGKVFYPKPLSPGSRDKPVIDGPGLRSILECACPDRDTGFPFKVDLL